MVISILIDKKDIHETPIRKIISPGGGGGTPIWKGRGCLSEILN